MPSNSQFPDILAGADYTAGLLASMLPLAAWKAADTSIASSATLANDPDLSVAVGASQTWAFQAMLSYTGDATGSGGIKFTWTCPSGGTLNWMSVYYSTAVGAGDLNASSFVGSGTTRTAVTDGTTQLPITIQGILVNGATAGNLQLQWAQNASDATATVMKAGSLLLARRLA